MKIHVIFRNGIPQYAFNDDREAIESKVSNKLDELMDRHFRINKANYPTLKCYIDENFWNIHTVEGE